MRATKVIVASLLLFGCGPKGKTPAAGKQNAPAQAQAKKAAPARDEAKFKLGEAVFKETSQPSCKTCHVLEAAGANGAVGPNLDALAKSEAEIIQAVTGGVGVMPAQKDVLTPAEIVAVAYYVVTARKAH